MNIIRTSALTLTVAVGLAACGGSGSSGGGGSTPATETRTFESSFINGVAYQTASGLSGITGVDCADVRPGCFDVIPGEAVTFTIGNLVLPPVVAAPGQARITVVDVAQAIDPEANILSIPAAAIVAYLDALNDGAVEDVDGRKVFNVRPVGDPEATVELTALVEEVSAGKDLKEALEEALTEAGEEEVEVNPDANRDTDLAKDDLGNGLEPKADAFAEPGLALIVADMLGLWTLEEEGGIGGIFFSNDGKTDFITSFAANQENGPELNLGDSWNVKDNQLVVSGGEDGNTECILVERSSDALTLNCIDFDAEGMAEDDEPFVITLTKVNNLAGILTNGDGIWNIVFEAFFNEEGTITFGSGNTFEDRVTSLEDNEVDTSSGTFAISGAKLTLNGTGLNDDGEPEDFTSECFFAGLKLNAQGQPEDIFFRCLPFEEDDTEEDILLTKRVGVNPLPNSVVRD